MASLLIDDDERTVVPDEVHAGASESRWERIHRQYTAQFMPAYDRQMRARAQLEVVHRADLIQNSVLGPVVATEIEVVIIDIISVLQFAGFVHPLTVNERVYAIPLDDGPRRLISFRRIQLVIAELLASTKRHFPNAQRIHLWWRSCGSEAWRARVEGTHPLSADALKITKRHCHFDTETDTDVFPIETLFGDSGVFVSLMGAMTGGGRAELGALITLLEAADHLKTLVYTTDPSLLYPLVAGARHYQHTPLTLLTGCIPRRHEVWPMIDIARLFRVVVGLFGDALSWLQVCAASGASPAMDALAGDYESVALYAAEYVREHQVPLSVFNMIRRGIEIVSLPIQTIKFKEALAEALLKDVDLMGDMATSVYNDLIRDKSINTRRVPFDLATAEVLIREELPTSPLKPLAFELDRGGPNYRVAKLLLAQADLIKMTPAFDALLKQHHVAAQASQWFAGRITNAPILAEVNRHGITHSTRKRLNLCLSPQELLITHFLTPFDLDHVLGDNTM